MSASDPFGGLPFFGDLAKLIGRQGPVAWEAATQLALAIATEGQPEGNVDPLERMRLEQLARIAEVQVNGHTGLSVATGGHLAMIEPVTRTQWVLRTIEAFKGRFEALAARLDTAEAPDPATGPATPPPTDPTRPEPPVPGLEDLAGLGDELSQFDQPATPSDEGAAPLVELARRRGLRAGPRPGFRAC